MLLICAWWPVRPDWAIYWTLGKFLKPLAAINLSKSTTFLGNFCKGVKIYHFFSEIILGNFYRHFTIFSGHTFCDARYRTQNSLTRPDAINKFLHVCSNAEIIQSDWLKIITRLLLTNQTALFQCIITMLKYVYDIGSWWSA